MQLKPKYVWPAIAAVAVVLLYLSLFSLREVEFALITQFGKPLYTMTDAGLNVKWPFQTVLRFDRRLRVYNPRPSEVSHTR